MKKYLVWFRNDFRISDNQALYEACKSDKNIVIALFISTPDQWLLHSFSSKKISFIYHHVVALKKQLLNLNIFLYYYESTDFLESINYLTLFCIKHQINTVFYNYQYEINERNRDILAKKKLLEKGINIHGFHDSLLVSIDKIQNLKNKAYTKFSAFKNKIIPIILSNFFKSYPIPKKRKYDIKIFKNIFFLKKYKINFDIKLFPIGEKKALDKLQLFIQNQVDDYTINRNFPYMNNTSMLSPYLSIGILSSRQCILEYFRKKKYILKNLYHSAWINEIIWREFYYHLLIGYPFLSKNQPLKAWEKNIHWNNNPEFFCAWKEGKTGFPIIDAGMRQLKNIGWMHNRLRMLTSSFLTKNLLINWREGEKYFMSQLIDGDFALNNGGWQWSASIGSDTVPYIRIFNPVLQSKKYDISGYFIRKFLPELKTVPNNYIHEPYKWIQKYNKTINYPKPIINYDHTKKICLLIFKKAKNRKILKEN